MGGHTSGLWRAWASPGEARACLIVAVDEMGRSRKSVASPHFGGMTTVEVNANASIMAAAPKLLEACEALILAYDQGEECGGSIEWSDVDRAWDLAKEAVAQAKGE